MKILTIVGCRPQFIKSASFSRGLKKSKFKESIKEIILHTGQHYDEEMSGKFFYELSIPEPKYNLGIGGGSHGENTGRMIEHIEKILLKEQPNLCLLFGDTDSTLSGAIAASKLAIPIAHIESGLRSFRKNQPEEINRVVTDHLSDICYTPSSIGSSNLVKEGIKKENIIEVGDIMQDNNVYFSSQADKNKNFIKQNNIENEQYLLVTLHRKENVQNHLKLKEILISLNQSKHKIIFPIHPSTKKKIEEWDLNKYLKNLIIINPCGFIDFATLAKNSILIITDSGGVQKEAYFYGKPCVTLREETEWPELVNCGWNTLIKDFNSFEIIQAINRQLVIDLKKKREEFYGNGDTSNKIINHLASKYL